jgi:hypothetical protein
MFRQYTKCYNHTPGDKPFSEDDLAGFAFGTSVPGLVAAIILFLTSNFVLGFVVIAIQYASTIIAIANEWLFHRLVCVSGDQCAIGAIKKPPKTDTLLGAFDNDNFFDIRLMPHRNQDLYGAPNTNFFKSTSSPAGAVPWQRQPPPKEPLPSAGPSIDGKTESVPENDIFLDNFQGTQLLQPVIADLPYKPIPATDASVNDLVPDSTLVTRSVLHCEAEGNFWQAMKDTAALQGATAGAGAGAGAAAGAAAGCAIGGLFGGVGCFIGAIIGFILGLLAGGAAGAYLAASAAFNSDPGDVNDANVGDQPLGTLNDNDAVVVFGTHVYDGFHTGWHEFHPLKAIARFTDTIFPKTNQSLFYPEWNPAATVPIGSLTVLDLQKGMASTDFAAQARKVKEIWCRMLTDRFNQTTINTQAQPQHRWTIHPQVDGCIPQEPPPPPPR